MQEEDDAMGDIIEKGKKFVSGIVKTAKKIADMVKFFMTQVRNGRGSNNIGHSYNYNNNCITKNSGKYVGQVARS